MTQQRSGNIAIVGRPNVGKSTLLNRILGQKISITSRKPQTTRYKVLGVRTEGATEMIFIDTPGWQRHPRRQLNRMMNRQVAQALMDIDAIVMVVDARSWTDDDVTIAKHIGQHDCPRILALNKHDKVHPKENLLLIIEEVRQLDTFSDFVPVCARNGNNVGELIVCIQGILPVRPRVFPDDQITVQSERFMCSEFIREKLIRFLGDELPYAVSVVIDRFEDTPAVTHIDATIWVERNGQKAIVIGKQGQQLKLISSSARKDIEQLLQRPVYMQTWVKVKENWADDLGALQSLGLTR